MSAPAWKIWTLSAVFVLVGALARLAHGEIFVGITLLTLAAANAYIALLSYCLDQLLEATS